MKTIEERLSELEARSAIESIVHKFCRAADRSDLEAVGPLFHPDAFDNHGLYEGDVSGLVEWMRARHRNILNASHNVSNIIIEFAGPDRALVESRVTVCIRYAAGAAAAAAFAKDNASISPDMPVDVLSFGRYVDVFERREDEWKIARRMSVPDQHIAFEAVSEVLASPTVIAPRRDQNDLVFQLRRELGIGSTSQ